MTNVSEISVSERQILDLIRFRSNGKHTFFGSNDYIGDCLSIKATSAKNMVNKLVRLGYLTRTIEGKKRYLHYTGKQYASIIGDMSNYDKARLKQEVLHYHNEYKDAEQQIELMKIEIEQLNTELDNYKHTGKVLMHLLKQFGFDDEKVKEVFPKVHQEIFGY